MERPPSLDIFTELFAEDYDSEAELLKDWENELTLYVKYCKGNPCRPAID